MQKIEYLDINLLKIHPNNPRLIKDEQFKILCNSIKTNRDYFETRPILCNKDLIIFAGNMRCQAAKEIGLIQVPVAIMDISKERQDELMIRDNVQNGEWDIDKLTSDWPENNLKEWGIGILNFKESEAGDGEKEVDENLETENKCPKCGYSW